MVGQAGRVIAAGALLLPVAAAVPDPATTLAGRYDERHAVRPHDGIDRGETLVEIVPVAAGAAYVRLRHESYGNHLCALNGVFERDGDGLRNRVPIGADGACSLRIAAVGDRLRLSDGYSCRSSCGVNAALDGLEVPLASRRPITYLARLKASPQYRAALAAWRGR